MGISLLKIRRRLTTTPCPLQGRFFNKSDGYSIRCTKNPGLTSPYPEKILKMIKMIWLMIPAAKKRVAIMASHHPSQKANKGMRNRYSLRKLSRAKLKRKEKCTKIPEMMIK
jgi:hypothetical protein